MENKLQEIRWYIQCHKMQCSVFVANFLEVQNQVRFQLKAIEIWKNIGETLRNHEDSRTDVNSLKSWIEMKQRLETCQAVDSASQRIITSEIKNWNDVILRIMTVIKLLSESSLAFRGASDKL